MRLNRMYMLAAILLDAGAGGEGGGGGAPAGGAPAGGAPVGGAPATSWRDTLPPELKAAPSLQNIQDVPSLAKSYLSAQTMLGSRVAIPGKDATQEQINEFYQKLGRPEAPDKYGLPEDVKLAEGLTLDDAKLKTARETFHKLGLTDAQARGVLGMYFSTMNETFTATKQSHEQGRSKAMENLQREYGDKLPAKIDTAKAVLKKFGDENLIQHLDQSGLGNDPMLIRLLAKVGDALLEDNSGGRGNGGLGVTDATAAAAKITTLKQDPEFMKALFTTVHPGHQAAVQEWTQLHQAAFPGKQD